MGLAERRALKEYQEQHYPTLKKAIDVAAGFAVDLQVRWDTLMVDDRADDFNECWTKVYFQPLVNALEAITHDAIGREAISAGLKKVIVQNHSGAYYGDRWTDLQDGVLTLDHEPMTNVDNNLDNVDQRTQGLLRTLERGL